jgi:nitrogen fixation/metabolism regulation signal transduction histidine kinase
MSLWPSQTSKAMRDRSRTVRWIVGLGLSAMAAIGLALLFFLAQATNNRALFERNYAWLFAVNVTVAALLLVVIAWIAWRLAQRVRRRKFGSRLLVKLAAVFALAGFMPGVLIYVVSYQFVSRSIESWFDVRVEGALNAGLNLGRSSLDALSAELSAKARAAAEQLVDVSDVAAALPLERARTAVGADTLILWAEGARFVASAGRLGYQLSPETPDARQFRAARAQRVVTWVEGLDDGVRGAESGAKVKALVLLGSSGLRALSEPRYLMLAKAIPEGLVADALAVTQANREYQERALARDGLKRMYIGTLTLSLFLAVFGAVLLAVVLGNQIARPLLLLADGVRQVAAGDLTPKTALRGKDELDGLTRSFADMTDQLADARQAVHTSMQAVDAARSNLQTILDNLTTGVIVLDEHGCMVSVNPGAARILKTPAAGLIGQQLAHMDGLQEFGQGVAQQFAARHEHSAEGQQARWQHSFSLGHVGDGQSGEAAHTVITLVARGAELPGSQRLLVFDDISEIVSAQRAQAWGEVARRLAHEIKNPLTPIQLSAERLAMKLDGKLDDAGQTLLGKSVKTIVDQVEAMKRLVNEFRDYARLPAAELQPLDLNALVTEVLQLYAADYALVPVVSELDPACLPIMGDAQQLRQVLHNLLQNAQDATASAHAGRSEKMPAVILRTQWRAHAQRVRLSVLDAGTGFPDAILKRAFEPYVTTKEKGTGLGLAVVKKIADDHGARIDIANREQDGQAQGAQVSLSFGAQTGGVATSA